MSNTVKKQGSLQPLRKSGVSRAREMPKQYPPVNVIPWDPYYPQYPPPDHQYLLQEPQYILQDPQYILQDPHVEVPPYPQFIPYPPQDVYPPVAYTYGAQAPNMAWGEAPLPIYGDWRQIPQNIHPVTKIEPIEIDEPVVVLESTKNIDVVSNNRGNAMLKARVKHGGSAGPAKMDILKLAMNKINVGDHNNIFVDEVLNPIDPVESSDENSLEQLEHNLASVENSLKHLESNLANKVNDSKSPKTVVDIVDSINNRFECPKETKGGPLENKMNAVLNNMFNEENTKDGSKVTSTEIPLDDTEYSQWVFDDSDLPSGWTTRSYNVIVNGKSIAEHQFLSPDQTLFTSLSSLIEYMRTEGKVSREIMENLIVSKSGTVEIEQRLTNSLNSESFEQDNKHEKILKVSHSSVKRPADARNDVENFYKKVKLENKLVGGHLFSGWMSDSTLPLGWKRHSRRVENDLTEQIEYQYLSPDIKIFKSRSDVNEYLKTSNSVKNNVDNVLTNTIESDHPRQSIIKHTNTEESLVSNNEYDDEVTDLEKLLMEAANTAKKSLANNKVKSPNMLSRSDKRVSTPEQDWEFDESLPNGWKKRAYKRKFKSMGVDKFVTQYQYMSPNGQKFTSRAQVVMHMEQSEKYSKEEITAVEKGKNCKGRIPVIKTVDETQADIAKDVKVDTKAEVAKGIKAETGANIEKDIKLETPDKFVKVQTEAKINKLMSSKNERKSTKERTPVVKVEAPVRISKYKTKPVATIQSMSTDWETDDDMLPEGWAKRTYENNNKVKVFQYCNNIQNPRNIFQSKIEVVRFMKNSKRYTLDEVFKFLIGVEKQNDASFSVKEETHFEFECNYCPLQFSTSNERMSHQQEEHVGQFRFKCNECGTGDLKKTSLMYHVRSKHEGDQKGEKITFDFEIPDKKEVLIQTKKTLPQPRSIQVNNIIKPTTKYDVLNPANSSLQSTKSISFETTKRNVDNIFTTKETIDDNNPPNIKQEYSKNSQNTEENLNKIKTFTDAIKTNIISEEQFGIKSEKPKIEQLNEVSSEVTESDLDREDDETKISNFEHENEKESSAENNEDKIDDLSDLDDFDSQIADIEENIEALTNKVNNVANSTIPIGPKITIRMDNFEILSLLFLATPNPIDTMIQDICGSNNMSHEEVEWTFIKLRNKFLLEDGEAVNREAMQEMVNQLKAEYESDECFEI